MAARAAVGGRSQASWLTHGVGDRDPDVVDACLHDRVGTVVRSVQLDGDVLATQRLGDRPAERPRQDGLRRPSDP